MIALKPVLHSWLEQAETDSRVRRKNDEAMSTSSSLTNSSSTSVTSMNSNNCSSSVTNSLVGMNVHVNNNGSNSNGVNGHGQHNSHNGGNVLMNGGCSGGSGQSNHDRKRKRTSIAAPEKRSLETFFTVQPRPSGEKIAQIAEKLELKKNVVRVWFCNQRQKQKRMKFNSIQGR